MFCKTTWQHHITSLLDLSDFNVSEFARGIASFGQEGREAAFFLNSGQLESLPSEKRANWRMTAVGIEFPLFVAR